MWHKDIQMVSANLFDIKVQKRKKKACFSNFCANRMDLLKTSRKMLKREKKIADDIQKRWRKVSEMQHQGKWFRGQQKIKGMSFLVWYVATLNLFKEWIILLGWNTVEPQYNKPLYNNFLDITHNFLYPSNSKIYGEEPWCNKTSF